MHSLINQVEHRWFGKRAQHATMVQEVLICFASRLRWTSLVPE